MSKLTKAEREFRKKFNEAPFELEEFAQAAARVEGPLGAAARRLLEATSEFEAELARVGVEVG